MLEILKKGAKIVDKICLILYSNPLEMHKKLEHFKVLAMVYLAYQYQFN